MTKTGNQKLKLNCWKPLWRTSRERRDPGPSCQAQATRGEGREGFYNDSAFSISYVTNIQSMQTGTLEALNLDPATILSPCPLHPLQITWLQWWGILQIHWEEKKSKKKPNHPILFDVSNSMVSLLAHKASIPFLHFFLWPFRYISFYITPKNFEQQRIEKQNKKDNTLCCRVLPAITVRSSPRAKLSPTLDKTSVAVQK